jgi:hypothetical protein
MRSRPDLIVPIRDRRSRKRILTLKNFGLALLAFAVIFAVITLRSEMRDPDSGDFGQLYERQIPVVESESSATVAEGSAVSEETHADPMLVAPAARAQWLVEEETPVVVSSVATGATRAEAAVATGETRVAIVGGTDGVAVVKRDRRKPELSGGFGRK